MSHRVPTLDPAAVERERQGLLARLSRSDGATPPAALTRLVHEAVDRGLPEDAVRSLPHDVLETENPSLAWAACRAYWDAGDRSAVARLAARFDAAAAAGTVDAGRILVRAAWTEVLEGRPAPGLDALRERVEEDQGPAPLLADLAHLDAYRALVNEADLSAALSRASLAAALYASVDDAASEVKARVLLARVQAIAGRLASSLDDARRAVERARTAENPRLLVQALNALGIALFRRGAWAEAERHLVRSDEIALAFGEDRWRVAAQLYVARLQIARGQVDRAASTLDRIDVRCLAEHAATFRAVAEEYRGLVRAAAGAPDEALVHYDRALAGIEAAGVISYERAELRLRRVEALFALDRLDDAHRTAQEALAELEATGQWLERGHLLRWSGRIAAAAGRPREAVEARDRAERALRRTGDRHELARCLLDRARSIDESEDRRRHAAAEAAHLFRALDLEDSAREAVDLESSIAGSTRRDDEEVEVAASFDRGLVAESPSMHSLLAELVTAAASDGPVLLQGETGTGKEVLARALHDRSPRAGEPFVPVNCSAIPETLFEREFFGHARGAFTGADRDGPGLVEAADGGTLFLDEIGEMPTSVQPKLLRLLQEGTFRRVGEVRERTVDLRIVAATNRQLYELAQQGEFREDLYYRLSWFELAIPPLRERPEDLVALARTFLARESRRSGRSFWLDGSAWRALRAFGWPGNVRQLESAVASSCARTADDGRITADDLPVHVRRAAGARGRPSRDVDLVRSLERYERELIVEALRRCDHRRTDAARALGIGRNTLYEKMKRLGIRPESPGRAA